MKIVEASYEILKKTELLKQIEAAGRVAYKSEEKITDGSADKFVNAMILKGHWPVLDMGSITMRLNMGASTFASFMSLHKWAEGKYIQFDVIGESTLRPGDRCCLLTGSPRALTEYLNGFKDYNLMAWLGAKLREQEPTCFMGLKRTYMGQYDMMDFNVIDVDSLIGMIPDEIYKKHKHIGVKFIHNRAFTHEIVRHRPCGFIQESQRYCRYSSDKFGNEVAYIRPTVFFPADSGDELKDMMYIIWESECLAAEKAYLTLLDMGASPQAARTVLPNSCKTEITVFCNLQQWEHMFRLRTSKAAEPSMRQVMVPLCNDMIRMYPMIDVTTPAYQ